MTVEEFLDGYGATLREICLHLRELIRQVMPDAEEIVFEGWRNISYGTGASRADRDLICYIAPYTDSVNLGFYRGALLPDEDKVLRGTGKLLRHIKYTDLRSVGDDVTLTMLGRARRERLGD